jgi:hypothetical protein
MANQDPYTDPRMAGPGRPGDPRGSDWSAGAVAAVIIAIIVIIAAISYGVSNRGTQTAAGPSSTAPSTSGQGGGMAPPPRAAPAPTAPNAPAAPAR